MRKHHLLISGLMSLLLACSQIPATAPIYPVGTDSDVDFAQLLWQQLNQEKLAGPNPKTVEPIIGAAPPHGWILEILKQSLTVNGRTGFVIVKRNYGDKGLTIAAVKEDRPRHLRSITVMYEREDGYDTENQNWFWVKYKPDGEIFRKSIAGKKVAVAGRFIKGKTVEGNGGCIYCHRSAGGGDYIFYPDIRKP